MDLNWIQTILAARNKDEKGWTNILFVVVMGAIWLVGGILKARANKVNKDEDEQENEPPQDTRQAGLQRQEQLRQTHLERRHLQQAIVKETPQVPFLEKPVEQKPVSPKPEPPEPPEKVSAEPAWVSAKKSKKETAPIELILELDSPDQLKKAILYHEILGKPISLRDL